MTQSVAHGKWPMVVGYCHIECHTEGLSVRAGAEVEMKEKLHFQ